MHGCRSTSVSLIDAEIDSMGDVEGGVVITSKKSPRSTAIEKVQRELRQEYNVREERKRELEFLENGGNPLEFKFGNDASVSVQSTSFIEQNPDLVATSEAKISFEFTESPRGDSVESSDRPGPPNCDPNSADNLMLFDVDSEDIRTSLHPRKSNLVQSEQSFQMHESCKTFKLEDSTIFDLPKRAYKRRYRSRRRDGTRSNLSHENPIFGNHDSFIPSDLSLRDDKDMVSCSKIEHVPSNCKSENASLLDVTQQKTVFPDCQQDIELDGANVVDSTEDLIKGIPVDVSAYNVTSENLLVDQHNLQLHSAVTPTQLKSNQAEFQPMEEMTSAVISRLPVLTFVNRSVSCQMNGFSFSEVDTQVTNTHQSISCSVSGLDITQNNTDIDGNDVEKNHELKNVCSNRNIGKKISQEGTPYIEGNERVEEEKQIEGVVSSTLLKEETGSAQKDGCLFKLLEELTVSFMNQSKNGVECGGIIGSEPRNNTVLLSGDISGPTNESMSNIEHQNSIDTSLAYHADVASPTGASSVPIVTQKSSSPYSKLGRENDEDSILKEAQIIETKRKRIMDLSIVTPPVETRFKSQWDYVLEEVAWLANDFAQERIWKTVAAAKLCHQATFSLKLRKQENSLDMEAKKVAHSLAKIIIDFWQSIKEQNSQKNSALAVEAYALNFMKSNYSNILQSQAEVPLTRDRSSDSGIPDLSWDDSLTEENLFYTVTPGAIETYRNSIEFYESRRERIGDIMQEEVETSECDAMTDKIYGEGEDDISGHDMPVAFEGGDESPRFCQKMRKQFIHSYGGSRPCEVGSYVSGLQYDDMKIVSRQSASQLKRPDNGLNVSIPTKRVRTASRRIISPFSAGTSGCMVGQNRTDASSGDTSSFQDDQSTLHGGSLVPHSLESDLAGEFENQLPFDSTEASTKFKKKPKHMNVAHKQRWQVDPSFQYNQRGYWKKGSDVYQHESNGSDGLSSQPLIKKLKMRHSHDISVDNNFAKIGGSVTSPAASQMSNMFNPNKIVKMIGGCDRDRGRKPKILKIPSGQPGSESLWSQFEDQALVVLVHDLGPNWELIGDAINDTLHFKCIFRKPKDCKERHIVLMDGTCGDGADSVDDSGSSQPYPSTLPGIPKGSARQLFQRLQEPVDEDTLNSHFDKIIMLGHKQHNRKVQDPKQLQQPHPSHTIALSQACPNNLNGGLVLTPLDFYEATLAGPDMLSLGYQGPNSSVLTNPTMLLNNNLSSTPASFSSSARYGAPSSASLSIDDQQRINHYNQITSARNISQHNLAASGSLQGTDRGARVIPGGNGLGMVSGVSRSMPSARPGLQGGVTSSSMLSSGGMVSPAASTNISGGGSGSSLLRPREASHMRPGMNQDPQRQMMTPDLQMQVSPGSSPGMPFFSGLSSTFPNQAASPPVSSYPIHHQLHHPASPQQPQVLSPHHPHFQGHASHLANPQHRAYAMRLAKERQLKQQRFLQQQPHQQQFILSNSLAPHMQPQSQLPISSPMQNNSQLQSQTNSPLVSHSPLTPVSSISSMQHHQQKHHTSSQISDQNAQASTIGSTNQMGKQRQRQHQHFSQANRQHPQQRQQSQSQQHAKVLNGSGRLNPQLHQTIPVDPSLLNGVTTSSRNQCLEKGEPAAPIIQNQGLYASSTQNAIQPMRQFISSQSSNQSLSQPKAYSSQTSSSSKLQQMTSHSDASTYGNVSPVTATQQSVPNFTIVGENHQQASPNQTLVNPIQPSFQRVRPTGSSNSITSHKPQAREFDTDQHPASGSSENNTLTFGSNENSGTNLGCLPSTISSSREPVLQVEQGHIQRPPPTSLPPTRHDVNAHWQQQPSHLQQSQQLAPSTAQQPQPQQQQPLIPIHSQQQTKLLQAGNGNLYGMPGDARI